VAAHSVRGGGARGGGGSGDPGCNRTLYSGCIAALRRRTWYGSVLGNPGSTEAGPEPARARPHSPEASEEPSAGPQWGASLRVQRVPAVLGRRFRPPARTGWDRAPSLSAPRDRCFWRWNQNADDGGGLAWSRVPYCPRPLQMRVCTALRASMRRATTLPCQ
jgi:hypothetical protein